MYEALGAVTLKSGEAVEAAVVRGPDREWADRIEDLLGHKGGHWQWQIEVAMEQETAVEAYYYLLHRDGTPLANMMTVEVAGVGYFGHVYTRPEERRQGAASQLMGLQMEHFRQRGGRALFLGTGYDSPPFHIYAGHGFVGIEPFEGHMEYYRADKATFESEYFAAAPLRVERLDWPHWPASAPLFLGAFPGRVRCAPLGYLGRCSTEGALLPVLRQELQRRDAGESSRVQVLRQEHSQGVVGWAAWDWDRLWPDCAVVDVYCHPGFWDAADELLASLALPQARSWVAYCDGACRQKEPVLRRAGFKPVGPCPQPVAVDWAKTAWVEVEAWAKAAD